MHLCTQIVVSLGEAAAQEARAQGHGTTHHWCICCEKAVTMEHSQYCGIDCVTGTCQHKYNHKWRRRTGLAAVLVTHDIGNGTHFLLQAGPDGRWEAPGGCKNGPYMQYLYEHPGQSEEAVNAM